MLSGAGERFRRYAPGLKARGINLSVITVNNQSDIQKTEVDGIPIIRLPLDRMIGIRDGSHSVSATLLRKADEYFKRNHYWPDILHILSHTLEGVATVWQIRMQGIPCVNSITMMPAEIHQPIRRMKTAIHQWIRYLPFNNVVTSSNLMSKRIHRQGISLRRFKTIPNGVDLNRFRPLISSKERINLRKKMGLDANAKIILYIGHIEPRKGIDLLINAWKEIARRIPHSHLVLVGSSELAAIHQNSTDAQGISYAARIERMIRECRADDRVHVFGQVEDVESFLRAADLFVFTSRLEGSPNVVSEAMACGLPCVLTPFDGFSTELGRPNVEFNLADFSSESIGRQVCDLLEDESKMAAFGKAARKFVCTHFDVEHTLDLYARLYTGLVRGQK